MARLYLWLSVAVALATAFGGAYVLGRSHGKENCELKQERAQVSAFRKAVDVAVKLTDSFAEMAAKMQKEEQDVQIKTVEVVRTVQEIIYRDVPVEVRAACVIPGPAMELLYGQVDSARRALGAPVPPRRHDAAESPGLPGKQ